LFITFFRTVRNLTKPRCCCIPHIPFADEASLEVLSDTTLVWWGPQLANFMSNFSWPAPPNDTANDAINKAGAQDYWFMSAARVVVWVGPPGTYPNARNTLNCLSTPASGLPPVSIGLPLTKINYFAEDVFAPGASAALSALPPGKWRVYV
jgi:hypothetical protein